MNKTISINLGGSVFNIEEDAYSILKDYLEKIKSNFSGDPAGIEIMADIEARISEIFHEKNSDRKNVVIKADVEHVIAVMGRPEDYRMDDDTKHQKQQNTYSASNDTANPRRKIYRDPDDAIIAGVCSGLSHYFKVDPIVIRLIMVVLTVASIGFPGVMGYLLFWALVPPANSTAEKLQMRGEAVNIENIGKFAKDEAKNAAERVSKFGKYASQNMMKGGSDLGRVLGKVLSLFFGFFFIVMGLGLIAALVVSFAFSEMNFFGFDGNNWDTMNQVVFGNDGTLNVLVIGFILTLLAPAVALLYGGIKLITGSTQKIKGIGVTLFSLFIIGIMLLVYGGVKTGREFTEDAEINNTYLFPETVGDTLFLNVMPDDVFIGRTTRNRDFTNLVKIADNKVYYGEPLNVDFEPTSSKQFKVTVRRISKGSNMTMAGTYARNIEYTYTAGADSLSLAPFFYTPDSDRYRAQEVEIVVHVPIGKYVHFGNNVSLLTWETDNSGAMRMDEDGLENPDDLEKHSTNISIEHPDIQVTDDSVIIRTEDMEIKRRRD
jgi:phage shock protein PspC (stress-responsive transcriptional regulator)